MKWLFTALINLMINSQLITSLIELNYHQRYISNYIIIQSGEPLQKYEVIIDLTSEITWLYHDLYFDKSTTARNVLNDKAILYHNNETIKCQEIEDVFQLNIDSIIHSFPYYSIINNTISPLFYAGGALGLRFLFTNIKYSFIHQLKYHNLIDHLSFSIIFNHNATVFYFGGIPSIATKNKYHSSCNVLGKKNNWNCAISIVKIINEKGKEICSYEIPNLNNNTASVTFKTNNHHNFVPKEFFKLLKQKVFKELLEKKEMNIGRFKNSQFFYMNINKRYNGTITFVIENQIYSISLEYFWDCFDYSCEFDLYENQNDDEWILSSSFLRAFNTHFDYENKKIYFYSNSLIFPYNLSISFVIFLLYIIASILLLIGITIILVSIKLSSIKSPLIIKLI